MTPNDVQCNSSDEPRPTGVVQPPSETALRALEAIDEGCLGVAEKHIAAGEDATPFDNAWKGFLRALLAVEQGDYAVAVALLQTIAPEPRAWTRAERATDPGAVPRESPHPREGLARDDLRLAARASEKLGWIYRRQDRPQDAYDAHREAYEIRNAHGSFEEVWDSAMSLALAADQGRHGDGQAWYRIAADTGAKASGNPESKQAAAWTGLSASLTKSSLHNQAVEAARTAQHWWQRHEIGDITAARAEMNLGHALLKQGESLHGDDPAGAEAVLEEAFERLGASREALLAFDPVGATDARWCADQADFARRLRDTLEEDQGAPGLKDRV